MRPRTKTRPRSRATPRRTTKRRTATRRTTKRRVTKARGRTKRRTTRARKKPRRYKTIIAPNLQLASGGQSNHSAWEKDERRVENGSTHRHGRHHPKTFIYRKHRYRVIESESTVQRARFIALQFGRRTDNEGKQFALKEYKSGDRNYYLIGVRAVRVVKPRKRVRRATSQ